MYNNVLDRGHGQHTVHVRRSSSFRIKLLNSFLQTADLRIVLILVLLTVEYAAWSMQARVYSTPVRDVFKSHAQWLDTSSDETGYPDTRYPNYYAKFPLLTTLGPFLQLLLARLMGQYCFAGCLLSSSVVVRNVAGGRGGRPQERGNAAWDLNDR